MSPKLRSCAGVLTGTEIKKYNLLKETPESFDKSLQAASYDLTVGDRHYIYEGSGNWNAIFIGEPGSLDDANNDISDKRLILTLPQNGAGKLVIPPFGSAIVQLAETVDLCDVAKKENLLISGRFDLKLKAIYKGLISQQATQVEPCYKGKLYCFLHNLGSQEISLEIGERIATIEFSIAGQELEAEERRAIIQKTLERNATKFKGKKFANEEGGIADIRWLFAQKMLPKECGIAPIYRLANGNVEEAVNKQLEKSDTVDKFSDRVGNRLGEKQNALKIVISLIVAVITYFATNLVLEIRSELKYFSEELAFLADSSVNNPHALQAINRHADELADTRKWMFLLTGVFIAIIVISIIFIFLAFWHMHSMHEQKWEHKRKSLQAKKDYKAYKKIAKESKALDDQLHEATEKLKKAEEQLNKAKEKLEDADREYKSAREKLKAAKKDTIEPS